MLKKPAIFFVLALYLTTATGFSLNAHYCLGQLASVSFNAPAKECAKERLTKQAKCCRNKHIEVKVKDVHQNNPWLFSGKIFIALLPLPALPDFIMSIGKVSLPDSGYRGPPLSAKVAAYVVHRNFRI
jgi:hypothetical protein